MYYYLCISSELTRFSRLVSVFRRIARFWTCNFSWSCHMISGRKLLYTKLQWIVFKEHSDWLLKFRKSFAIHLWATRAGFIVIVAGTNKAKSSFCAPLPHFLVYAVLKQRLTNVGGTQWIFTTLFRSSGNIHHYHLHLAIIEDWYHKSIYNAFEIILRQIFSDPTYITYCQDRLYANVIEELL